MFAIHHVALIVSDIEKTIEFYENLFGFQFVQEIKYDDFTVVFLNNSSFNLELIVQNQPFEHNVTDSSRYDHLCFETKYFTNFLDNLIGSGYVEQTIVVTTSKTGTKSLFINGINGEKIQVLEDIS